MGHSRAEGHKDLRFNTEPHDGVILTETITQGRTPDGMTFVLGSIVGNLQGDLMLDVRFPDGEEVHERLDMSGMLTDWVIEIAHSKRIRDDYGPENV